MFRQLQFVSQVVSLPLCAYVWGACRVTVAIAVCVCELGFFMRHVRISFIIIWLGYLGTYHVYATYNSAERALIFLICFQFGSPFPPFRLLLWLLFTVFFVLFFCFSFFFGLRAWIRCSLWFSLPCSRRKIFACHLCIFCFHLVFFVVVCVWHFWAFVFYSCCTLFGSSPHSHTYTLIHWLTHTHTLTRVRNILLKYKLLTISFALDSCCCCCCCCLALFAFPLDFLGKLDDHALRRLTTFWAEFPTALVENANVALVKSLRGKVTIRRQPLFLSQDLRISRLQVTHFSAPTVADEVDFSTPPRATAPSPPLSPQAPLFTWHIGLRRLAVFLRLPTFFVL